MSLIDSKDSEGSGLGEFKEARQLDISNKGDLFITDFGNNRVQILDSNLQYKRHISHHSMLKPCDVKLTPDEGYVLGDSLEQSSNCMHIFTHMGEKLRFVILNWIPNRLRCRGFCVDTFKKAIVIENATPQVKFFTKGGNLFETMNILGDTIGVAWMTNQKLVILSRYSFDNILEIYSSF